MASRGYCLLMLASLPVGDPGREYVWSLLIEERGNTPAMQKSLADYKRRGFVTTYDYLTTVLTSGERPRKLGGVIRDADGVSRFESGHRLYRESD